MDSTDNKTLDDHEPVTSDSKVEEHQGDLTKANGDEIAELRRILVDSEEVSQILPAAVTRSKDRSSELSEATLPIVEQNIRDSVVRDPKILADALFPVIGPAIRKAISTALSSMVQSFNQTLEYSVSPQGLRWRLEAMRTGRSFGEVVMLKTLQYRVEQVFLIHRETGLLLQHVAVNPADTEDADMVGSMLTAISDFAHDSFEVEGGATLDSFKISGLAVWIESSPDGILATAIRGNPPIEFRREINSTIESIQLNYETALDQYQGQSEVFEGARPDLERLLVTQSIEQSPKTGFFSPANLMLGFLGLLFACVVGYFAWDYWKWSGLVEDFRNEPGYVLTDYKRGWFTHSITGLKDPLSRDSGELVTANRYDLEDVTTNWREFHDSDPVFAGGRANKLLKPPENIGLHLENKKLSVKGPATAEFRERAARIVPAISGIDSVVFERNTASELEKLEVEFETGTLNVVNVDIQRRAVELVGELAAQGSYRVELTGFADKSGSVETNKTISKKRAVAVGDKIIESLKEKNTDSSVEVVTVGSDQPIDKCKVSFKVTPLKR